MFDYLIKNARVIDGTGSEPYASDVAISEGRIYILKDKNEKAEVRCCIDAKLHYLCPGFIDVHSHGDQAFGTYHGNISKISQGITTQIVGQCGETPFPISEDPVKRQLLWDYDPTAKRVYTEAVSASFTDFNRYISCIETLPHSVNYMTVAGHTTLRIAEMGFDSRQPRPNEMGGMKKQLELAMENGCLGLSSGLIYFPACYANSDEVRELCKVIASYNGLYTTHLRNEASKSLDSIKEAIDIVASVNTRLQISHHKICGKDSWGLSEKTLELIDEANSSGINVCFDAYPYLASLTHLNICLPQSFFANGPEAMKKMLSAPIVRAHLASEIERMDGRYRHCGGFGGITVMYAPQTPEAEGLTVSEYARRINKSPFDAYFDMIRLNGHSATAVYRSMCKEDLIRIISHPRAMIGTDGLIASMHDKTHPRTFGSFPKAIRYFVKDMKLFSLHEFIHKMTGLPAKTIPVPNKGLIKDGYDADLLLFDYDSFRDTATYSEPVSLAHGIDCVFVNGQIAYKDKQLADSAPGRFIPHRLH